ncbi:CCA tRNA nucleotidyltransferase [Pseudokordiimonas caeni]|uniref:CCA tRNA nucleotidyltransferase n=1 Tax=Pseudokordiimonas caeni TaxID=2997908 RepID=UPI00281265F3|nr:CCA tRNA nucleotidyltransferase [Pseudokordiimonas caeni]
MANVTGAPDQPQEEAVLDLHPDWLDLDVVRAVTAALGPGNLRFVGGAVRDTFLGRPVLDLDAATPLKPNETLWRLEAAGLRAVPTGIDHGTVTAVAEGRPVEITTLRRDAETDGRHARIEHTDDWAEDAARRDFTVNALYLDPEGRLYDPVGGLADVRARRLRFIGDPARRLAEDRLRLLRYFRFMAVMGGMERDEAALAAIRDALPGLAGLSAERKRDEFLKLLKEPAAPAVIGLMQEQGVLKALFSGLDTGVRWRLLMGLEIATKSYASVMIRLVALLGGDRERMRVFGDSFRLSRSEARFLDDVAKALVLPERPRLSRWQEAAYRFGRNVALAVVWLSEVHEKHGKNALEACTDWDIPAFPVKAADLMADGIPAGPALGKRLKELEERWIENGFSLG